MAVISLGRNIASLGAQRALGDATASLTTSYERLSSGQRINHASDDAAGLSVASGLQARARVLGQASRNANDGLSTLSIADSALADLSRVATRIQELAEQSANGVYSSAQRIAIDNEGQALANEYSRIVSTTSFNGINLLNGSTTQLAVQVGGDSTANSRINVVLGSPVSAAHGDGTFDSATTSQFSFRTQQVETADLNGDGKLDMVVSGTSGGGLSVRLGNGDGTFAAELTVSIQSTNGFVVGDFNGDGKADLIAADYGSDRIGFYRGLGDGTFAAAVSIDGVAGPAVTSGDINGDGIADLFAWQSGAGKFVTMLGNGNGTFKGPVTYTQPGNSPITGTAVGDVNNDGYADFLTTVSGSSVILYTGSANGTLSAAITIATSVSAGVFVGDVNSDGNLDIVSGEEGNGVQILLGNGNGTFKAPSTAITAAQGANFVPLLADLNGDGSLDYVGSDASGNLLVALNNGNGTFKSPVTYAGTATGDTVADVNHDGAADILAGTYNGQGVDLYLGNPVGQSQFTLNISAIPSFSLRTQTGSRSALDSISSVLDSLSSARGKIGASQSRIMAALSLVENTRVNLLSAAQSITDVDVAQESANLVREQILQQAAATVLAHANQEPALAIKLLGN